MALADNETFLAANYTLSFTTDVKFEITDELAAAKAAAHEALTAALATYTEGNYSSANWTILTGFKTDGDTAIDAATDVAGVTAAQTTATDGMAGVEPIEPLAVEATGGEVSYSGGYKIHTFKNDAAVENFDVTTGGTVEYLIVAGGGGGGGGSSGAGTAATTGVLQPAGGVGYSANIDVYVRRPTHHEALADPSVPCHAIRMRNPVLLHASPVHLRNNSKSRRSLKTSPPRSPRFIT